MALIKNWISLNGDMFFVSKFKHTKMVGKFIRGRREAMGFQGSNRQIVIIPTHPKLAKVPFVNHDNLDVLDRPQGTYPKSFVQPWRHGAVVPWEIPQPEPFFVILSHGTISTDLSGPLSMSATISIKICLIKDDEITGSS